MGDRSEDDLGLEGYKAWTSKLMKETQILRAALSDVIDSEEAIEALLRRKARELEQAAG